MSPTETIYHELDRHVRMAHDLYQKGKADKIAMMQEKYCAAYNKIQGYLDTFDDDWESLIAYGNAYWTLKDIGDFINWLGELVDNLHTE